MEQLALFDKAEILSPEEELAITDALLGLFSGRPVLPGKNWCEFEPALAWLERHGYHYATPAGDGVDGIELLEGDFEECAEQLHLSGYEKTYPVWLEPREEGVIELWPKGWLYYCPNLYQSLEKAISEHYALPDHLVEKACELWWRGELTDETAGRLREEDEAIDEQSS